MAQSSGTSKSHKSGQREKKISYESKKICELLHKLCFYINEHNNDGLKELYKFSTDYILKNSGTVPSFQDDTNVAESIRTLFMHQRGQGDGNGNSFNELYGILQRQTVLKHSDASLRLLLQLSNTGPSASNEVGRPVVIPALSNVGLTIAPQQMQSNARSEASPLPSSSAGQSVSTGESISTRCPVPDYSNATKHTVNTLTNLSEKRISLPPQTALSVVQPGGKLVSRPKLTLQERKIFVPEWALIQDLIYSFQGINGRYLKYDPISQGYNIDPKVSVRPHMRRLCLRLAELSWFHMQVRDHCKSWVRTKSTGLVHQSLTAVMREELTDYYRVVALIRTEASFETYEPDDNSLGAPVALPSCDDMKGITLRRLAVWTQQPQLRFMWLAVISHMTQGLRGGAIASCVYSYLQHGDPAVREIVKRILTAVCKPMFAMLGRWILDGELDDPYGEFFIAGNSEIRGERLWHEKYRVQESMVPTFITMEQARKILITGKSINFLREVCNDQTELRGREVLKQALESTSVEALFMSDREGELAAMMDTAYLETSKRVIEVLTTQYKFLDHLQALRRYMLLGQGDFIRHLMELLEPELQKPATELFPHNLSGILESAIRATNAQYEDKDILNRLDVRFLDQSPGDCGWDVFVLDYHTDGPIGTVFGPSATAYLLLFQALWKMKRVEWVLSRLWTKQITASKELRKIPELDPVMAQIHLLTSEMVHFVHQMQYYVLFEVVACAWEELLTRIAQAESLDDIVTAHESFLRTVKSGALLDSKTLDLSIHLRAMFETILQLEYQVDLLHNRANKEMKTRAKKVKLIEARGKQGKFGITAEEEKRFNDATKSFLESFVPNVRVQLKTLTNSYQSCARKLLYLLGSSQDISLQLLSFRLDFNEHYKRNDPRLSATVTYQQRRLSEMGLGLGKKDATRQ